MLPNSLVQAIEGDVKSAIKVGVRRGPSDLTYRVILIWPHGPGVLYLDKADVQTLLDALVDAEWNAINENAVVETTPKPATPRQKLVLPTPEQLERGIKSLQEGMPGRKLKDRDLEILRAYFSGFTISQLAHNFDLSRQRVSQIVQRCCRYLRHPRYRGDDGWTP
jgi:hypothetical protein